MALFRDNAIDLQNNFLSLRIINTPLVPEVFYPIVFSIRLLYAGHEHFATFLQRIANKQGGYQFLLLENKLLSYPVRKGFYKSQERPQNIPSLL